MPLVRQSALDGGSTASFKSVISDSDSDVRVNPATTASTTLTRISTSRLDFTVPRLGQHPDLVLKGSGTAAGFAGRGGSARLDANGRLRPDLPVGDKRPSLGLSRSDPELNALVARYGKRRDESGGGGGGSGGGFRGGSVEVMRERSLTVDKTGSSVPAATATATIKRVSFFFLQSFFVWRTNKSAEQFAAESTPGYLAAMGCD